MNTARSCNQNPIPAWLADALEGIPHHDWRFSERKDGGCMITVSVGEFRVQFNYDMTYGGWGLYVVSSATSPLDNADNIYVGDIVCPPGGKPSRGVGRGILDWAFKSVNGPSIPLDNERAFDVARKLYRFKQIGKDHEKDASRARFLGKLRTDLENETPRPADDGVIGFQPSPSAFSQASQRIDWSDDDGEGVAGALMSHAHNTLPSKSRRGFSVAGLVGVMKKFAKRIRRLEKE